jgi:hypothetical protein
MTLQPLGDHEPNDDSQGVDAIILVQVYLATEVIPKGSG